MIASSGGTYVVPPTGFDWRDVHVLENTRIEWSEPVLAEVGIELDRHEELGYDAAHDDAHGVEHLIDLAEMRAMIDPRLAPDAKRRELVVLASLAVAAIKTIDRRAGA